MHGVGGQVDSPSLPESTGLQFAPEELTPLLVGPDLDAQVERIFGCFLTGPVCLDTTVPLYFEIHGIADKFKGPFKDRPYVPNLRPPALRSRSSMRRHGIGVDSVVIVTRTNIHDIVIPA